MNAAAWFAGYSSPPRIAATCGWYDIEQKTLSDLLEYAGGARLKLWPATSHAYRRPNERLISATCAGCKSGHAVFVDADHPIVAALERVERIKDSGAARAGQKAATAAGACRGATDPRGLHCEGSPYLGGTPTEELALSEGAGTGTPGPSPSTGEGRRPAGGEVAQRHPAAQQPAPKVSATVDVGLHPVCPRRGSVPTRGRWLDCGCPNPRAGDPDAPAWVEHPEPSATIPGGAA